MDIPEISLDYEGMKIEKAMISEKAASAALAAK
jgi:hypothetical protein